MDKETEVQKAHVTCLGHRASWRQSQALPEPPGGTVLGQTLQREGEAVGEAAGPHTLIYQQQLHFFLL